MNDVIHIELEWQKVWDRLRDIEDDVGTLFDGGEEVNSRLSSLEDDVASIDSKMTQIIKYLEEVAYTLKFH